MILALDLGTTTGWAIGGIGRALSGSECFKPGRFQGGGMRFVKFRGFLDQLAAMKLDQVVFEEVRAHKGVDAAHVYGGLMAVLTEWCEMRPVPYEGVPVGVIKKYATGKGNANKDAMIEAVRGWGYAPVDDNEADALALLHWKLTSMVLE